MDMSMMAAGFLTAMAAGGVAYVFLYPLLSGDGRAEKRQKALVRSSLERHVDRVASGVNRRREQIVQSLKELETREKARNKLSLEQRMAHAGLSWTRNRFIIVSAVSGAVLGFALYAPTGSMAVTSLGLFAGSLGLPRWGLGYLKKRRIAKFLDELPNAMDLIVRGVRAGLPLGDCLRMIATEAQEPVRSEFRAIIEAEALGVPLGDSVTKLYERVPVAEANFFAIVISIQQKSGGNLAEAIGNLSKVVRERKRMAGKIAAMSMEAKASAGIIAILPIAVAILTYIASPAYIQLLWTTNTGKVALAGCGMWMMVGLLVMKKMITFKF
jgi:tight adherence protein B